jgi:hypothetical protein
VAASHLLKKVKRFLKFTFLKADRGLNSFRYAYFKPSDKSEELFEANLLVVKKKIYASVAKVCVESFLFFHPKSSVVIHVDTITSAEVTRVMKKWIIRGTVKIRLVDNEYRSWQEIKLEIILNLIGIHKFFMDADLRWNGPIPVLNGITLFVEEFKFSENLFYKPLVKDELFEKFKDFTMKNTSFVYWGNHTPQNNYKTIICEFLSTIRLITEDPSNSIEFRESTSRISEQIALSFLIETIGKPFYFLKDTDGFKDGSFLESSYFGATNVSF